MKGVRSHGRLFEPGSRNRKLGNLISRRTSKSLQVSGQTYRTGENGFCIAVRRVPLLCRDAVDRAARETMLVERLNEGLDRAIAVAGDHAVLSTDLRNFAAFITRFALAMKAIGLPWRNASLTKWMARPDLLNAAALSPPKTTTPS